jgi:hypothetical protein
VNNGGVWTPVQPASSVLSQLTSLDDYMSIDQSTPYDAATVLLPAVGSTYVGNGKPAPASGSWAFYFDPPRWPLFQWSGYTNQILAVHIWVTNAATVNWIAAVRYLTNGLTAGPGNGVQQRNIATGIFQCATGTNDYWIYATNNWPTATMTNVQAAQFFFGSSNPSTNAWVIQGTHLHAQ